MLRAALFDLDCTLLDRHRTIEAYAQRFIADFEHQLRSPDIDVVLPALRTADGGGYRTAERPGDILAGLSWHDTPTSRAIDEHWRAHTPGLSVLMDGAFEVLHVCRQRNLALAIVTNGQTTFQQEKIDALQLEPLVDAILISETVGCNKPDPRIFAAALTQLDVEAAGTVYIGDHPINDVIGATQAGLHAIWLTGSHVWPKKHPPHALVADSLGEVVELIDRLG